MKGCVSFRINLLKGNTSLKSERHANKFVHRNILVLFQLKETVPKERGEEEEEVKIDQQLILITFVDLNIDRSMNQIFNLISISSYSISTLIELIRYRGNTRLIRYMRYLDRITNMDI